MHDYYDPPYTVIGTDNDDAFQSISTLFGDVSGEKLKVPIKVAEMIKMINNSFHALKVGFANEIGNICKQLEIDSHEMMTLFCKDTRLNISPYYFKPGFAYGGSCLPKDLKALNTLGHDFYIDTPILKAIEESNSKQIENGLELVKRFGKRKVALIGLSFKAGTDDLRNSPYVELAERLIGQGYHLSIFDEHVYYSNLVGSNKSYIDEKIPHLRELISNDLSTVVLPAETIVIGRDVDGLGRILSESDGKNIVDLCKIRQLEKRNVGYQGICW